MDKLSERMRELRATDTLTAIANSTYDELIDEVAQLEGALNKIVNLGDNIGLHRFGNWTERMYEIAVEALKAGGDD